MSAVDQELERPLRDENPSSGLIDFILARMSGTGVSRRKIAALTGIRRSRIHSILHSEADKRSPLRVDELQIILRVLVISELEAAVASEVIESAPGASADAVSNMALMMSEFLRGLPAELFNIVGHIEGLHHADIRREHGLAMRKIVVRILTDQYQEVADRRAFREATPDG